MGAPRRSQPQRGLRKQTIEYIARSVQVMLLLAAVGVALLIYLGMERGAPAQTATPSVGPATTEFPSPRPQRPTASNAPASPSPTSGRKRVGILAGHSGPQNDPGAVCPDGLREADINLAVAEKVVAALAQRGYAVDLLEEFDDRLPGYQADAFLSIHTDSCEVPEASGFKVARVSFSAIPDIEDVLVECLYNEYERATGLPRHDFSITPEMHEYHAFMQIAPETPGAIIELGFLSADRLVLVRGQDRMAAGITAGLLCFLEP